MKQKHNGMHTFEAFLTIQLVSMMPPPTPAHLAALNPIPSSRYSAFLEKHQHGIAYDDDWWPNQQVHQPDVCDYAGHWMEISCSAESGHEAGSCILCGFGFSHYM